LIQYEHPSLQSGEKPRFINVGKLTLNQRVQGSSPCAPTIDLAQAEGKPTGRIELRYGKDGEAGYLRWLAANHPGYFAALYGKL
jgi:hypothetical protein